MPGIGFDSGTPFIVVFSGSGLGFGTPQALNGLEPLGASELYF